MRYAKSLLIQLGALDDAGYITPHGEAMSRYGVHPRLAHMMQKAKEMDLGYEASLLAVLVSEKDIYRTGYRSADLKERVLTLHDVAQKRHAPEKYVDIAQCRYLLANARRLEKRQPATLNAEKLGILLAFAYPDRIAQLRHANRGVYLLSNGKGAQLHLDDPLFNTPYLVVPRLDAKERNATIYSAIAVEREDLLAHLDTHTEERVTWNVQEGRVEVREAEIFGKLVLKERQLNSTDNPEVQEVLLAEIEALGLDALQWSTKATRLQQRAHFLHLHDSSFPDFSKEALTETLDVWLSPYLEGITTLKACRELDLYAILLGQLSYAQMQMLDTLAPETVTVASGSAIHIDYSNPHQPVLAVRLQEMFGTRETPTVLNGKIPLMLHLLSPASRPMQMTTDLESFWRNTYPEVRKELRGRYKKHYWPENPLEAQATAKTKRFM
jgi:ATP-dependent helicase HrpB